MKEKLDNFLLFIKTNSLLENKLQAGGDPKEIITNIFQFYSLIVIIGGSF